MAIQILKIPGRLEQAVRDVANEANCFHLASTLNRMGMRCIAASQNKFLSFSPLPLTHIAGSISGDIALPSWGWETVSFTQHWEWKWLSALSTGRVVETHNLSKSFFSKSIGIVSDKGFSRLAALVRLIADPLAAMHSLN